MLPRNDSPHYDSAPSDDTADVGPPALPDPPPERFQFHLKHLLAFMLASALLAAGARLVLDYLRRLPDGVLTGWPAVLLGGFALGGLAYFFLRGPFLAMGMIRASRRWDAVRAHRRELARWAEARRSKQTRIMDESD
jgi:hypothetical protein